MGSIERSKPHAHLTGELHRLFERRHVGGPCGWQTRGDDASWSAGTLPQPTADARRRAGARSAERHTRSGRAGWRTVEADVFMLKWVGGGGRRVRARGNVASAGAARPESRGMAAMGNAPSRRCGHPRRTRRARGSRHRRSTCPYCPVAAGSGGRARTISKCVHTRSHVAESCRTCTA